MNESHLTHSVTSRAGLVEIDHILAVAVAADFIALAPTVNVGPDGSAREAIFVGGQSEREVQDPLNRGDLLSRKALFPSAWSSE